MSSYELVHLHTIWSVCCIWHHCVATMSWPSPPNLINTYVDVALAQTTGKYASVWEKICSRHYLDALITRCPFYPSLWFPYKSKRSMFRLRLWINSDSKCSKMGICISFVAYPAKIGIYFHEGLLWHARSSQMNFHLESSLPRCLRKHLGQGVSM